MLNKGDKVPDFTLPLATADGKKEFQLSQALGKGDVVLAFFPIAFSGVCTKEVCEMRDNLHFFAHVGAQVYGFSVDTPHANIEFVKAQKLGFPIVSDPNHEVVGKIWETMTVAGIHGRAKRGVMIVDSTGVVKHVWKTDDPGQWPGLDEVKRILHAHHHHH